MTVDEDAQPVTAFISYSWSAPAHQEWVLALATRLRQDGVNVILDKWDLKPGHDAYQFMEQMVTDKNVTRVVMICDKAYVEKADQRKGGVGTESQIISPELYGRGTQDKFAAVITELDENGNPCVPIFYKGRIHIDFSISENYEIRYEELLRWILGRPEMVKPAIGKIPRHIADPGYVAPATESQFRRADEAVRKGNSIAAGLIREFSDGLATEFERLRPIKSSDLPIDEAVIKSIADARPLVEQTLRLASSLARFATEVNAVEELLNALERIAQYMFVPEYMSQWGNADFDGFKYICNEIFLGCFGIFLKENRFDLALAMLNRSFFVRNRLLDGRGTPATRDFELFSVQLLALDSRNQRLQLRRLSLHADLLKSEYENGSLINFDDLMQADLVLYLVSHANNGQDLNRIGWYPQTLIYSTNLYRPFQIFARSESAAYFEKLKGVLHIASIASFKSFIETLLANRMLPTYGYIHTVPIKVLTDFDHLGIRK